MSTLQNEICLERLHEAYLLAIDDYDIRHLIAEAYLEPHEYYCFCKEDAHELFEYYEDEIMKDLQEAFFYFEGSTYDIVELLELTGGE